MPQPRVDRARGELQIVPRRDQPLDEVLPRELGHGDVAEGVLEIVMRHANAADGARLLGDLHAQVGIQGVGDRLLVVGEPKALLRLELMQGALGVALVLLVGWDAEDLLDGDLLLLAVDVHTHGIAPIGAFPDAAGIPTSHGVLSLVLSKVAMDVWGWRVREREARHESPRPKGAPERQYSKSSF